MSNSELKLECYRIAKDIICSHIENYTPLVETPKLEELTHKIYFDILLSDNKFIKHDGVFYPILSKTESPVAFEPNFYTILKEKAEIEIREHEQKELTEFEVMLKSQSN